MLSNNNRGGIAHKNEFTTTQGMHVFCLDLKTIRLLLPMFILFRAVEWLRVQFAHVAPPLPRSMPVIIVHLIAMHGTPRPLNLNCEKNP